MTTYYCNYVQIYFIYFSFFLYQLVPQIRSTILALYKFLCMYVCMLFHLERKIQNIADTRGY